MLGAPDNGALAHPQVINNFGPLSNAELLRRYGFVETDDNPHDCLEISVDSVLEVGHLTALAAPPAISCHQLLKRAAPLNNSCHVTCWKLSSDSALRVCSTSSDPGMLSISP